MSKRFDSPADTRGSRTGTIVGAKHKWRSLVAGASAAAALLLGLAGPGNGTPVAQAADTGVLSSANLKVASDGEFAAGDTSWGDVAGLGKDTGTDENAALHNNVVRSNDYITYTTDINVSTAGDVTFVFNAPTGLVWDPSVTQNCNSSGTTLSSNRQTFTCVKTVAKGNISFPIKAQVVGLGNGAVVPTATMKAGNLAQTAATVPYGSGKIIVSAVGKANALVAQSAQLNADVRETPGLLTAFKVILFVPVDQASGTKGVEPLASSFTYKVQLPSLADAEVVDCASPVTFGTGTGVSRLTAPGAYTCELDKDDPTILNVTVTGADSAVSRWPTITTAGVAVAPGYAVFSSVNINIWYPVSSFPTDNLNPGRIYQFQVIEFDPQTISGASNYGSNTGGASGYAPNQQPGASCIVDTSSYVIVELASHVANPTNCHTSGVNLNIRKPDMEVRAYSLTDAMLSGNVQPYDGKGLVVPGAKYQISANMTASTVNNPVLSNASFCFTWDNALQQLDSTRPIRNGVGTTATALTSSTVKIEYAAIPFITDDQRASFNCGVASSGNSNFNGQAVVWSETPTDVTAVTAIRWTWVDSIDPGEHVPVFSVPMVRTTTPLPDDVTIATDTANVGRAVVVIPTFLTTQYTTATSQDKFVWTASTYVPATNAGSRPQGGRVLANNAEVQVALSWDDVLNVNGKNNPGTTHTITVTPSLVVPDGGQAQDVTIQVQLPNACVTYQDTTAKSNNPNFSVTGVSSVDSCNGLSPGPGQILTFNLGNLTADTVKPITFNVNIDAVYQYNLPGDLVATATSYTDSDLRAATSCIIPVNGNTCTAIRTAQGSLPIAYDANLTLAETVSTGAVLSGSQYSYQISWMNHRPDGSLAVGTGLFVDVLPFNGDASIDPTRGTTGLGGLHLDADVQIDPTSTHASNITVQYTCQDAATVLARVMDDPSNTPDSWWQDTRDCQTGTTYVTAVRFITPELQNGTVDSVNLTVTPLGVQIGGVIVNTVYGETSNMAEPLQDEARVVSAVHSLSGNVFNDLNYNFVNDLATNADSLGGDFLAGATVGIVGGYTYGANAKDDTISGDGGDDIALNSPAALQQAITDGLVPAAVSVNPVDGSYSFPEVNPGNYQLQLNLPNGYQVAILPDGSAGPNATQPATGVIVSSQDVTDVDFGIQKILEVNLTDKSISGKANGETTDNVIADQNVLAGDDLISNDARTSDEFTGDDAIWQPPVATITVDDNATENEDGTVTFTSAEGGTVTLDLLSGAYTYKAPAGLIGENVDSFTYTVTDVQGHTATATVNITLTATGPVVTPGSTTVLLDSSQEDPSVTTTVTNGLTLDDAATPLQTCEVVGDVNPDTGQASIAEGATDTSFGVDFTATAVGVYTVDVRCEDSFDQWSDPVTVTVTVVSQAITIQLQGAKAGDKVGDLITWTYTVKNTGTADLTNIAITDSFTRPAMTAGGISALDESLGGDSVITCPKVTLAPDESMDCTSTSAITLAQKNNGFVPNTATVVGIPVINGELQDATATATSFDQIILEQNPVVTVEKTAEVTDVNYSGRVDLGDQIVFKITVTNDGDVSLHSVTVKDSMEDLTLDCGQPNGTIALDPGQSITCTTSVYTITADDVVAGEVVNVATADGQFGPTTRLPGEPGGDVPSEPSQVTVTVQETQAPTGGQLASDSWLWLGGIAPLLAGAVLLIRRRQSQAGGAV